MIYLYTGTPGSGKSYHATLDVYKKLNKKNRKYVDRVISNYYLNLSKDNFIYLDNSEITTKFLYSFAVQNHKIGLENQTLLVIDEAQILFNSRDWNSSRKGENRMDWIKFFSQHRKFGYNIILIAQNDRMIDRQIRALVEYEVAHMKINNYFRIIPITVFLAVNRWYGQKMKLSSEMFLYRKKIAALYNSYEFFDDEIREKIAQ